MRRDFAVRRGSSGHPVTAQFSATDRPGNLRIDYVLPSRNLQVRNCGVFWPAYGDPGAEFVTAIDHRLVRVDLNL